MSINGGSGSLEFLRDAFPTLDEGIIAAVLQSCGNDDLERAMELLFEMTAGSEEPSGSASEVQDNLAVVPERRIDDDANDDLRLALELQAQFDEEDEEDESDEDREDSPSMVEDQERALALAVAQSEADDAAYAARLQNEEFKATRSEERLGFTSLLSGTHSISNMLGRHDGGAGRGGGRAGQGALTAFMADVGSSQDEIYGVLVESFIPEIEAAVKGFEVPEIEEEVTVPRLGEVSFGCSGSTMESFQIPAEHLKVKITGDIIRVTASHINGKVSKFDWHYEQSKFPKLKDSGKARAKIDGASIDVALRISNAGATVTECNVKAGKVKVSVSGSKKSVIYNIVLATVVRVLKGQVESGLADLVREAFE